MTRITARWLRDLPEGSAMTQSVLARVVVQAQRRFWMKQPACSASNYGLGRLRVADGALNLR